MAALYLHAPEASQLQNVKKEHHIHEMRLHMRAMLLGYRTRCTAKPTSPSPELAVLG